MKRIANSSAGQRGYALVLVMVALVTLTILGVTSITAAQLDMKITQNMRHHKQLQYGAMSGQQHARAILENGNFSSLELMEDAHNDPAGTGCTAGWISADAGSVELPLSIDANGFVLASYDVSVCRFVCGGTPVGFQLSGDNSGPSHSGGTVALDVVATGTLDRIAASAQSGALLVVPDTQGCNR